jgi:hypothetical protein
MIHIAISALTNTGVGQRTSSMTEASTATPKPCGAGETYRLSFLNIVALMLPIIPGPGISVSAGGTDWRH